MIKSYLIALALVCAAIDSQAVASRRHRISSYTERTEESSYYTKTPSTVIQRKCPRCGYHTSDQRSTCPMCQEQMYSFVQ